MFVNIVKNNYVLSKSSYADVYEVDIQETQKDLSQGEQPKTISVFFDLKLVVYNIYKDIQESHNMRSKIEKSY